MGDSDYLAFQRDQVKLGLEIEPIGDTSSLYGDLAVVQAVWRQVMDNYNVEKPELRNFDFGSAPTTNVLAAAIALREIVHSACIVVPNNVNQDPKGGILIVRKLTAKLEHLQALGVLGNNELAALLRRREVKDTILLVSQQASETIDRFIRNKAEELQPRQQTITYYSSSSSSDDVDYLTLSSFCLCICGWLLCCPLFWVIGLLCCCTDNHNAKVWSMCSCGSLACWVAVCLLFGGGYVFSLLISS